MGANRTYCFSVFELILTSHSATGSSTWYNGRAFSDSDYKSTYTSSLFYDKDFYFATEPSKVPAYWYPFTSTGNLQYLYIPALLVEGKNYTGVHKFQATNGLPPTDSNYIETTFYWVKGIGIIKKEVQSFNSARISVLLRHGQI